MANWHISLGLSVLCLTTACGSAPQPEASAPSNPAPEMAVESMGQSPDTNEANAEANPDGAQASAVTLSETTILPGESVGPITRNTSRTDLAQIFGEAALEDTEIQVGEGFTESGTRITLEQEQSLSVIWVDSEQSSPSTIKDFGQAWQTPEGIAIGTPFAELQAILGPFELYGFGWDYGGTVVLESSDLAHYYGKLILRLQPADPTTFQTQAEAFQAVQGDKLLTSDDSNLPPLDLVVHEIIVYLDAPVE